MGDFLKYMVLSGNNNLFSGGDGLTDIMGYQAMSAKDLKDNLKIT